MGKSSNHSRAAHRRQARLTWLAVTSVAWLMAQPMLANAQQNPVVKPGDTEAPLGTVPQIEQLKPAMPLTKDGTGALSESAPPKELGKPNDDTLLDVTSFAVNASAPEALKAALPGLTASFTGPQRSYEDLVNAASAVTRFMQRELGYYLAYAYLPEQVPKDGVIKIEVLDGRLDQVIVQWPENLPVKREIIEGFLAKLQPGDVLKVRDVERVVFLINDLYGIRVRFEVKSGRTAGTASLVVTPQAEARTTTRVDFDINGSRYSGAQRLSGVASWASPLGRGDNLTASGLVSTTGGLKFGLLSYSSPVGNNGLKLGASVSAVKYQLDKSIFQLDLHGDATSASVFALYPLIRSRNLNVFTSATLENKEYTDTIASIETDKRTQDLQLGLVGDFRDNLLTGGVNAYELNWMRGKLSLNNTPLPLGVPANFNKYGLGFSRLQNLISGRLLGYVRYKGQIATTNLDTTERFGMGGPTGIRAYAPGEGTADIAHILTTELRWLPPESMFGRSAREMVFSAFYDIGKAKIRKDLQGTPSVTTNTPWLGGAGFGFVWDRPQSFAFRVSLAWATAGEAVNDKKEQSPRMYAVFSKSLF